MPNETLQESLKYWPFKVRNVDTRPMVEVSCNDEDELFYLEQVSCKLAKKRKTVKD